MANRIVASQTSGRKWLYNRIEKQNSETLKAEQSSSAFFVTTETQRTQRGVAATKSLAQTRRARQRHLNRNWCRYEVPQRAGYVAPGQAEARNPKFETNSSDQNSNDLNKFKSKTGKLFNKISRNCALVVQRRSRQDQQDRKEKEE